MLLRDDRGAVALLTLNRPQARNCFSWELMERLDREIEDIAGSKTIKAVVIAGNGPVFSSGHDIKELTAHRGDADGGRAYYEKTFRKSSRMMRAITRCPKPVIAAVTGTATAAGCQLVATCDLAVAGADSRFATPGVHISLFCSTPMVALSRNIGRKRAMEMLLLGETIGAEEAAAYGLINRVAPRERVQAEALAMAEGIAGRSSAAIAIGKRAFYAQVEETLADAYDGAAEAMVSNMMTADAQEGLAAFLEKRAPRWRDA